MKKIWSHIAPCSMSFEKAIGSHRNTPRFNRTICLLFVVVLVKSLSLELQVARLIDDLLRSFEVRGIAPTVDIFWRWFFWEKFNCKFLWWRRKSPQSNQNSKLIWIVGLLASFSSYTGTFHINGGLWKVVFISHALRLTWWKRLRNTYVLSYRVSLKTGHWRFS